MPETRRRPIPLTEAEWKVMSVVWRRAPVTVREVLEALEDETGWAYSTVKTLLARLVEKGALTKQTRGNAGIFEARLTEREARGSALRSLLNRAFDGTLGALVHHLVEEESLSEAEQEELQVLMGEEEPSEASSGKGTDGAREGSS